MKRSLFFIILLTISSLALAGTAAYFSIFGLSKLFYGAGIGIIILASVLEFSKLVAVSYVYRYWNIISKLLRAYYVAGIVVIMLITSLGIYGFLTSAYQKSSNKIELRDSQIKIAENKKTLFVSQLDRMNKSIESDDSRINKMSDIRNQQENRVSSLYNTKLTTSARRTENQISSTDNQIKNLNDAITLKMTQITSVNDSISYYDQKILEYKSSDVTSEVGPLKYLSDLTGFPMNKIVNILVLLIIFVFDPMAISLLIGVNQLTMMEKGGGGKGQHEDIKIPKILRRKFKMPKFGIPKILKKKDDKDIIDIVENEFKNERLLDNDIEDIDDIDDIDDANNIENIDSVEKTHLVDVNDELKKSEDYIEKIVDLEISDIKENLNVYHSTFGKGKILKSNPDTKRILIHFDDVGIKELNSNFANLKEIRFFPKEKDVADVDIPEDVSLDVSPEDIPDDVIPDVSPDALNDEYEIVSERYVDPLTPWLVGEKPVRRKKRWI